MAYDHAAYIPAGRECIQASILHPVGKSTKIRTNITEVTPATITAVAKSLVSCPVNTQIMVLTNLDYIPAIFDGRWTHRKHHDLWERLFSAAAARSVTIQFCNDLRNPDTGEIYAGPGRSSPGKKHVRRSASPGKKKNTPVNREPGDLQVSPHELRHERAMAKQINKRVAG